MKRFIRYKVLNFMKKIILSSLIYAAIFSISSCSKEVDNSGNVLIENEVKEAKGLIVILEGVFPKNDRFELFYSNDQNFNGDKMIRIAVYGEPSTQKIIFQLPDNEKPQNLRIDLGSNTEQKFVSIKDIRVEYKGKVVLDGRNEKYLEFFPENSTVDYLPNNLTFELKNNLEGDFDPILFSNDNLKKELNKVYNTSNEDK